MLATICRQRKKVIKINQQRYNCNSYHWSIYDTMFAIIGVSLVALISILKTALFGITQSEQEFSEIDRLIGFYSKYLNKIEGIWYDYNEDIISENEMIQSLFDLKVSECDRYSSLNRLIRSISIMEQKQISKQCEEYLSKVYLD